MISLCIITKNNEKTLANCLASVKPIIQEIILVDTGSTDKTIEIAKEFQAKIFHFSWNNNFSDAKNYALEQASEEWILALDADEAISQLDYKEIQELIKDKEASGFFLIQRNYTNQIGQFNSISTLGDNYKESRIAKSYVPRKMIRLFKNSPEIRFEGAVHDSVEKSIKKFGKIKDSAVQIHHFGLLDRSPERIKQYIEIEKANLKDDWFQDYQIAAQLHSIGNLEESITFLNKSIANNPIFALSWLELGIIQIKQQKFKEALESLNKSLELEKHPMTLDHLGIVHSKLGNYKEAEYSFKQAISLLPNNADIHFNLGLLYNQQGKKQQAFHELKIACQLNSEYNKYIEFS
jgi:glycosyltransferase involved in cell wall biosynthesis